MDTIHYMFQNDHLIAKYGDEHGLIKSGAIDLRDRLDYPQRLALRYLEVENVAGMYCTYQYMR